MGRRRDGNHSIQNSVGNEENRYSVPDPNKTMINVTKMPTKKTPKTTTTTTTKPLKKKSGKKSLKNS
jgi:hypothetical protein